MCYAEHRTTIAPNANLAISFMKIKIYASLIALLAITITQLSQSTTMYVHFVSQDVLLVPMRLCSIAPLVKMLHMEMARKRHISCTRRQIHACLSARMVTTETISIISANSVRLDV